MGKEVPVAKARAERNSTVWLRSPVPFLHLSNPDLRDFGFWMS